MKMEESTFIQDNDTKQIERIKVSEIDIIVSMINGKPYYEIKYKKVGEDYYHIGYSSYNLDFVLEWKDKCFEVVSERKSVASWIPVKEKELEPYRENKLHKQINADRIRSMTDEELAIALLCVLRNLLKSDKVCDFSYACMIEERK